MLSVFDWFLTGLSFGVGRDAVHERDENRLDIDIGVQFRNGFQQHIERLQVEIIFKNLQNRFNEIFLRNDILARHNLFQYSRKHGGGVDVDGHCLQLRQAHQVRSD